MPCNDFDPSLRTRTSEGTKHVLADFATELGGKSGSLTYWLHLVRRTSFRDIVGSMNCRYSNLSEGNDTHPIDIDQTLSGTYSTDSSRRDQQCEVIIHIEVLQLIDRGGTSPLAHGLLVSDAPGAAVRVGFPIDVVKC